MMAPTPSDPHHLPRLSRLINDAKNLHGLTFELIGERTGIDRGKIGKIAKGTEDVALKLSQLRALHEFLSGLSQPGQTHDMRLFQEAHVFEQLRSQPVTVVLQVSYPAAYDRETVSAWDRRAIEELHESLRELVNPTTHFDIHRISTDEQGHGDWRALIQADEKGMPRNRNLFAFGSPRAHHFSSVMLEEMYAINEENIDRTRVPFRFVWNDNENDARAERLERCPFVANAEAISDEKIRRELSEFPHHRAFIYQYQNPRSEPDPQERQVRERDDVGWQSYSTVSVQRRGERLFVVFAGLSAVDTYSASKVFVKGGSDGKPPCMQTLLRDDQGDHSQVAWWVIKTTINKQQQRDRNPPDFRHPDLKKTEVIGPSFWSPSRREPT